MKALIPAALAASLAVPAWAASVSLGVGAPGEPLTQVELAQTEYGDWYVELSNRRVNTAADEGSYALDGGDVAVTFEFDWQHAGSHHDAILVTPPEGLACVPATCLAIVPEGGADRVWLVPAGVGM